MRNLKFNIVYFVFLVQIIVFGSCQSLDENTIEIHGQIDAAKGSEVISLFEEIDWIALTLLQYESAHDRTMTLTVEGFCQETAIIKNIRENSVTVDFGNGCVTSKGVKRAGSIKVISSDNFWSQGSITQIIMNSFFIDGVKVSGSRTLTNKGFDQSNRHLIFETIMRRGEVTWPMEQTLVTDYMHDRMISLPTGKSGFTCSLIGKTEIRDHKGNSLLAEIVKPMVFLQSCMNHGQPIASSGSLAIIRSQTETLLVNFDTECK